VLLLAPLHRILLLTSRVMAGIVLGCWQRMLLLAAHVIAGITYYWHWNGFCVVCYIIKFKTNDYVILLLIGDNLES
jgi:hypothetical protein